MGIDIYARWSRQTKAEKEAQYTGFSTVHGHVGYLREAYHGEPYATRYLVREAFESATGEASIPARTLRERLPHTLALVEERERRLYRSSAASIRETKASFTAFVALCEEKERERGPAPYGAGRGEPCAIVASY